MFVPPPYDDLTGFIVDTLLGIGGAALLVLLIRWVYFLVRRREGIGLGDAKLMALLAAWMGLPLALLSFGIGVILAAIAGVVILARPRSVPQASAAASTDSPTTPASPVQPRKFAQLPLGTFLCIGGIVAHLWGQRLLALYLQMFNF